MKYRQLRKEQSATKTVGIGHRAELLVKGSFKGWFVSVFSKPARAAENRGVSGKSYVNPDLVYCIVLWRMGGHVNQQNEGFVLW